MPQLPLIPPLLLATSHNESFVQNDYTAGRSQAAGGCCRPSRSTKVSSLIGGQVAASTLLPRVCKSAGESRDAVSTTNNIGWSDHNCRTFYIDMGTFIFYIFLGLFYWQPS